MTVTVIAVIALLLAAIGVTGIVVPVLPGSITVLAGLLLWTLAAHPHHRWPLLVVGGLVVLLGMLASTLLTKRNLDARKVPGWPVAIAGIGGILGMFLLPGPGLVIGFVAVLLVIELVRVQHVGEALRTTWEVLKAVGAGMLIEFTCAISVTAAMVWSVLSTAS